MGTPSTDFEEAMVAYLLADSTLMASALGVYTNLAPPDRAEPYVAILLQPGATDHHCMSGNNNRSTLNYEISGVTKTPDLSIVRPIADRLETLLDSYRMDTTSCYARIIRRSDVERQNTLMGSTRYTRLGAIWRVELSIKF